MNPYRLRERSRRDGDAGSLPLAMLLIIVGVGFSAVLAASVLSQMGTTRDSGLRAQALGAAQAGLDVTLTQIRAARDGDDDGNPIGDTRALPCLLTGQVDDAGTNRYRVVIVYLDADHVPRGKSDSWLEANDMPCTGNGVVGTPKYAVLRSTGTGLAAGDIDTVTHRTLRATYTFRQSYENVAGGLVHVYKTLTSLDLCLDAGSDDPAEDVVVLVEVCSPGSPQQTFAYNTNLNLVLVSTVNPGLGMCLQAPAVTGTGTANVTFQPCLDSGDPLHHLQQWSFNGATNFMGATASGGLASYCFNVRDVNTPGSPVIVRIRCHAAFNNEQGWSVEASVGAGMASDLDRADGFPWLVNYKQFGRCADVTHGDPEDDLEYLIVWPCKQEPSGNVDWNQQWTTPVVTAPALSETGRITTLDDSEDPDVLYCMRSPLSTAPGQYVWVAKCPGLGSPPFLTWTRFEEHDDARKSYTIQDNLGNCLSPTDPKAKPIPDLHFEGESVSKMIVAPCDGSTLQKWNAPPSLGASIPLKDIGENLRED